MIKFIQLVRFVVLSREDDIKVMDKVGAIHTKIYEEERKEKPNGPWNQSPFDGCLKNTYPLLEKEVWIYIGKLADEGLARYSTTLEQDEEIL